MKTIMNMNWNATTSGAHLTKFSTRLLFVDFNSPGQSGIELVHCPVEGDVLEQFEPGTEHVNGQDVRGGLLPEAQGVKVSKGLRFSEERLNN